MKLITLSAILITATIASASCKPFVPTIQPVTMPELPLEQEFTPEHQLAIGMGACVDLMDESPPVRHCEDRAVVEAWLTEQSKGLNCRARLTEALRDVRAELTIFSEVTWGDPLLLNPERLRAQVKTIDTLLQECP